MRGLPEGKLLLQRFLQIRNIDRQKQQVLSPANRLKCPNMTITKSIEQHVFCPRHTKARSSIRLFYLAIRRKRLIGRVPPASGDSQILDSSTVSVFR